MDRIGVWVWVTAPAAVAGWVEEHGPGTVRGDQNRVVVFADLRVFLTQRDAGDESHGAGVGETVVSITVVPEFVNGSGSVRCAFIRIAHGCPLPVNMQCLPGCPEHV